MDTFAGSSLYERATMLLHFGVLDVAERPLASRMERRRVSTRELLRLVNDRVRELPNSGTCRLGGVLPLSWPDDDGCNWQPGGIKGVYTQEIFQAIRESQAKYNLEDSPVRHDLEDEW
jgi:hypothetical protein